MSNEMLSLSNDCFFFASLFIYVFEFVLYIFCIPKDFNKYFCCMFLEHASFERYAYVNNLCSVYLFNLCVDVRDSVWDSLICDDRSVPVQFDIYIFDSVDHRGNMGCVPMHTLSFL